MWCSVAAVSPSWQCNCKLMTAHLSLLSWLVDPTVPGFTHCWVLCMCPATKWHCFVAAVIVHWFNISDRWHCFRSELCHSVGNNLVVRVWISLLNGEIQLHYLEYVWLGETHGACCSKLLMMVKCSVSDFWRYKLCVLQRGYSTSEWWRGRQKLWRSHGGQSSTSEIHVMFISGVGMLSSRYPPKSLTWAISLITLLMHFFTT